MEMNCSAYCRGSPAFKPPDDTSVESSLTSTSELSVVFLGITITVSISIFVSSLWRILRKIAFIDWIDTYKLRKVKAVVNKYRRPPVVQGHLIWGSGPEICNNAAAFLQKVAKKYGDVALLRVLNRKVAVVTDVHSFENFCHEPKFDFRPIINQVNRNVFGFSVIGSAVDEHRKWLVQLYRTAKVGETVALFDRHLNQSLQEHVTCGQDLPVHDFVIKTGFLAIYQTLLGTREDEGKAKNNEGNVVEFYSQYSTFAKYFNYLWLGIPLKLFPQAFSSLESMFRLHPSLEDIKNRHDVCPYFSQAYKLMRKNGNTDEDILRHSIELIHVHANVVRLAYWMLVFTLSDEEAKEAVIEEIDTVVSQKASVSNEEDDYLEFELEEIEGFQSLSLIFKETLRLVTGVVVIRAVTQDTLFTVANGNVYQMNRGETVFFYPPSHHRDAEIFDNPDKFIWNRFLQGASFVKNGKLIEKPVLGFGSMCIGQRFATILTKWYIIQLLHRWRMSLTGEVPKLNEAYQGHEVLPPLNDTTFSFEPRLNARNLRISSL